MQLMPCYTTFELIARETHAKNFWELVHVASSIKISLKTLNHTHPYFPFHHRLYSYLFFQYVAITVFSILRSYIIYDLIHVTRPEPAGVVMKKCNQIAVNVFNSLFRKLALYIRLFLWETTHGREGPTAATLHCPAGPLAARTIYTDRDRVWLLQEQ